MADFRDIIREINNNIPDNNAQEITAAKVRTTMVDMMSTTNSEKQDTLVSSTNIKTINNQSLLGSGNITIQGGGGGDVNVIESISVNTVQQQVVNKNVDITVPTKTSDLTNDSGFITASALNGYATETYVQSEIAEIDVPTKTSDLINDSDYATEEYVDNAIDDAINNLLNTYYPES